MQNKITEMSIHLLINYAEQLVDGSPHLPDKPYLLKYMFFPPTRVGYIIGFFQQFTCTWETAAYIRRHKIHSVWPGVAKQMKRRK